MVDDWFASWPEPRQAPTLYRGQALLKGSEILKNGRLFVLTRGNASIQ